MSAGPDHLPEDVGRTLDRLADEDAATVLAEARANAVARAREVLESALVERLLARTGIPAASGSFASAEPGPTPRPADSISDPVDAEALYLYGVVSADALPTVTIAGVSSRGPVETITHGALAAMVSRVPINEFGDENLKQNVERMDWLERTARGHEAVVENISTQTTVVPMRICTLFRSADSVREMLTREAEPLANALDRLAGCKEWGVKALADMAGVRRTVASSATAAARPEQATTGRAYIAGRQADRRADREIDEWVRGAVSEVHETLTAASATGLRNPLHPRELSGYEDEMVLNGVYLVPDAQLEDFRQLVDGLDERYAASGLRFELTGPWPPYNFVSPPAET